MLKIFAPDRDRLNALANGGRLENNVLSAGKQRQQQQKPVALNCKSAVSTSCSTIQTSNNHQHPRSSSLNTRKPKQKLMSNRKRWNDKKEPVNTTLTNENNKMKSNRKKNAEQNRNWSTTRRIVDWKFFAVWLRSSCVSFPMCDGLFCFALQWHCKCTCRQAERRKTTERTKLNRTLGIHATNVTTKDPLICAFVLFCASSRK